MPRLSDKHIAAIRAAAEDNDQTYGFGDVILLCDELQERRAAAGPWTPAADLAKTSAKDLINELIKCVEEKEPLRDADVLALFHAMQRQDYFQTLTFVNKKALETVVLALTCTEHPHVIRELQVTRGLPLAQGEATNPIDQLIQDIQHASAKPD